MYRLSFWITELKVPYKCNLKRDKINNKMKLDLDKWNNIAYEQICRPVLLNFDNFQMCENFKTQNAPAIHAGWGILGVQVLTFESCQDWKIQT